MKRLLGLFRRRPRPESHLGWAPGDLACCRGGVFVWRSSASGLPAAGPEPRELVRVHLVSVSGRSGRVLLHFEKWCGGYDAAEFVRLGTRAEHLEAELIASPASQGDRR